MHVFYKKYAPNSAQNERYFIAGLFSSVLIHVGQMTHPAPTR